MRLVTILISCALFLLVAGSIVKAQTPLKTCSQLLTNGECSQRHGDCLWTFNPRAVSGQSLCQSVLPCALEINESACNMNTWDCQWRTGDNICESVEKIRLRNGTVIRPVGTVNLRSVNAKTSPVSGLCSARSTEIDCRRNLYCQWKNAVCTRRPNIIISVVEGFGWYDAEWNNPRARSPVLNGLRTRGVALDRHYAARMTAPGRAALLSGVQPWRMGLQTDMNLMPVTSIRCAAPINKDYHMATAFKQAGNYSTHGFGKWGLGMYRVDEIPTRKGFDTFIGMLGPNIEATPGPFQFYAWRCACRPKKKNDRKAYKTACDNHLDNLTECKYFRDMLNSTSSDEVLTSVTGESFHGGNAVDHADYYFAHQAATRIVEASTSQPNPYFMYIGWISPHQPEQVPDRMRGPMNARLAQAGLKNNKALDAECGEFFPPARRDKLAVVGVLDDVHRIIVEALDKVSELDSTLIVFLSTNGGRMPDRFLAPPRRTEQLGKNCALPSSTSMNYPLRGGEFTNFDGGIRTHAFVSLNGLHSRLYKGLVSITDWKATLLAAAGLEYVQSLRHPKDDSMNLWPALSGTDPNVQRTTALVHVWKEKNQFVLFFTKDQKLWKIISGMPTKAEGGGYDTFSVAYMDWIKKGSSRLAIELPLELPVQETDPAIIRDSANQQGRDPLLRCGNSPCIFDIMNDPSELNPWAPPRFGETHIFALNIFKHLAADYVPVLQSGLCEKGWHSLRKLDVTDYASIKDANRCSMVVPWRKSIHGVKPNKCISLF